MAERGLVVLSFITHKMEKLFSVVKHFRNGSEPMFIQENLTLEQAKKIVNSFPDSQETMVTMLQQEKS